MDDKQKDDVSLRSSGGLFLFPKDLTSRCCSSAAERFLGPHASSSVSADQFPPILKHNILSGTRSGQIKNKKAAKLQKKIQTFDRSHFKNMKSVFLAQSRMELEMFDSLAQCCQSSTQL